MIKADTSLNIQKVLSCGGPVAGSFAGFELRNEQIEMASAVQKAFLQGRHLAVEAGTGVGKSFAYLVPAIDVVRRKAGRVLVSTFTITLQEQLINKDIPFLADCLGCGFTAVLAKGRGNYLCKRRLDFAMRRQMGLFDEFGSTLAAIKDWVNRTKDGSLSDIPFVPKNIVWDAVNSEHGNCRGRKCPYFRDCFYQRARRRMDSADIIVANHALLFSDLALRQEGTSVLPDYNHIIIDEAHNIESVAEDHFGINISNRKIRYLLDGLYNPRTHRGLLVYSNARVATDLVGRTYAEAGIFFKEVRNRYEEAKERTQGRCHKNFIDDTISEYLKKLRLELAALAKKSSDEDEKFEFARFADRCASLAEELNCFLTQDRDDYVYWVELAGPGETVLLRSAPINVGPDVKKCLFDKYKSIILTSATLSSGGNDGKDGFDFFAGRIGLEDFDAARLGSPFDYEKQVTVYVEKDLPDPNAPAFIESAAEAVKKYILKTNGKAFVLFTSYSMLNGLADRLADWFAENDIEMLCQGGGIDRSALLKHFRSEGNFVLFGTDSFWQGVDVPGEALSNVIIVRLPFEVPDQPLLAGRLEQIKERGGNPFFDYQLPSAIIRFRQGFGRLIRSKTDTGIVVILDSRIINKRYGERFLAAIPRCSVRIVGADK